MDVENFQSFAEGLAEQAEHLYELRHLTGNGCCAHRLAV
jgi:hypothetical protein